MNLHKEFVSLAFDINKMKNRLMSLLLEIYEQKIYRDHGCETIFEYGFKYARLSRETVLKAIRILKNLEGKPNLKKAIQTQGIHKVAMVATIATPETDQKYAEHVENMSKSALFEFAKEVRHSGGEGKKCAAAPTKIRIELDREMQEMFFRLKLRLAKGKSNEQAMKIILKKLDGGTKKGVPGNGFGAKNGFNKTGKGPGRRAGDQEGNRAGNRKFASRYVPVKIKREILADYGGKCAYPGCVKGAENLHHKVPFAFNRSHESVVPLCRVHHEFAHNGLIRHELKKTRGVAA